MNKLIDLLEALDGKVLPPTLFFLLAALAAYLLYKGQRIKRARRNEVRDDLSSNSASTFADLQSKWVTKRDYTDALRAGPVAAGNFRGWLHDEQKICDEFSTQKKAMELRRELKLKEHPSVYEHYLAIVAELGRKPESFWAYLGLLLLMAVEATGFSLIFADRLSDTASAQAVEHYAYGIAMLIAFVALVFAHITGVMVYRQGYARSAHLLVPGGGLRRTVNGGQPTPHTLKIGDDAMDDQCHQSVRIVNRSDYVNRAAGKAQHSNKMTPRFTLLLWVYIAVVIVFGALVASVRLGQIDEYYAKEAQKAVEIAKATAGQQDNQPLTKPPAVTEGSSESDKAVTQEALDVEKRGKVLAISVFVAIFYIVQAMGVLLASGRGFASNEGKKAYLKIEEFKQRHGDLNLEQYKLKVQNEIDLADRYAQDTLHSWQLGLQTAYNTRAINVEDKVLFDQSINDLPTRTYAAFLRLKGAAAEADSITPILTRSPESGGSARDALIDYYVKTLEGGEAQLTGNLDELKIKVMDGEIDAGQLMVRESGAPSRYQTFQEFLKSSKVGK